MQNAYSINQSETLPLNYVNKPLVNNLSDRGTGQRACIRYYYERYIIYYVNIEQSKATLTLYNVTTFQLLAEQPDKKKVEKLSFCNNFKGMISEYA